MDLLNITHPVVAQEVVIASDMFQYWATQEWEHNEMYIHHPEELKINDLDLMINLDTIKFSNPVLQTQPKINLVNVIGNLLTLSSIFSLTVSDLKITGNVESAYQIPPSSSFNEIALKNISVDVLAGLYISDDSFSVDNIAHNITNCDVSFSYQDSETSRTVFPLENIPPSTRKSLESYIANELLQSTISLMYEKIETVVVFDQIGVSDFLGVDDEHRDVLWMHKQKLNLVFNQLFDEVTKLTNERLSKNDMNDFFIKRLADVTIHLESGAVVVFGFVNINRNHTDYTHDSIKSGKSKAYVKISIRKMENNHVELNLTEFKITELSNDVANLHVIPQSNYQLQFLEKPKLESYIREEIAQVLTNKKLISLAVNPSNLEDLVKTISTGYGRS